MIELLTSLIFPHPDYTKLEATVDNFLIEKKHYAFCQDIPSEKQYLRENCTTQANEIILITEESAAGVVGTKDVPSLFADQIDEYTKAIVVYPQNELDCKAVFYDLTTGDIHLVQTDLTCLVRRKLDFIAQVPLPYSKEEIRDRLVDANFLPDNKFAFQNLSQNLLMISTRKPTKKVILDGSPWERITILFSVEPDTTTVILDGTYGYGQSAPPSDKFAPIANDFYDEMGDFYVKIVDALNE